MYRMQEKFSGKKLWVNLVYYKQFLKTKFYCLSHELLSVLSLCDHFTKVSEAALLGVLWCVNIEIFQIS